MESELAQTFAQRLKQKRAEKGYSQREVAAAVGISQALYAKYELASVTASVVNALKLARFFDTDIYWLMDWNHKKQAFMRVFLHCATISPRTAVKSMLPENGFGGGNVIPKKQYLTPVP